jgi:hypothetical protein
MENKKDNLYKSCNEMIKNMYKRDFSNPCPTTSEIDWSKRLVNLDRPQYYGEAGSTYEVFNVLEAWGLDEDFYLGNAIKYIVRAGKKTSTKKEDLQKALVYLQRRIDKL